MLGKVTELARVSSFCPTQWTLRIEDGREYYIRYRHSGLTVTKMEEGELTDDIVLALEWHDGGNGGEMTDAEMKHLVRFTFDFEGVR